MLAGRIVVETFNYGIGDASFPIFTENGSPVNDGKTGEQLRADFKLLVLEVLPGMEIEIRVRAEQWDDFVDEIGQTKIKTATLKDLNSLTS